VAQEDQGYITERIERLRKLLPGGKDKETIVEVDIKRDKKGFWELELSIDSSYDLYRATEKDKNLREAMDRVEEVKAKLQDPNYINDKDFNTNVMSRMNISIGTLGGGKMVASSPRG
jgi:hypothetical protein